MATNLGKLNILGTEAHITSTGFCVCSSSAETKAKVATLQGSNQNSFNLIKGTTVHVFFDYSNTTSNPTLSINGSTAYPITRFGSNPVGQDVATSWRAGAIVPLTFNGNYWIVNSSIDDNTTYSVATTSANGLMSKGDKDKLDGIQGGANLYIHPDTHPASIINAMTGYSKPTSTSAIKATDSLNTAIGKLEKALDGKGTSNFTGYTSSNKLSTSCIQNDAGWTSNAGTVVGSSLTDGYFVMGNGGVNVDISDMKPTKSSTTWSTTSDVNVPTMKAISNYVTGLGYISNVTAAAGTNINTVGDPNVTASTSNGVTTLTFNYLKGAKGDTGASSEWFTGTAITGTSTTAKAFSSSGISAATVGDMYLNSSTYNVYRCETAGNASAAKWKYICNIKGAAGSNGTNGTTPTIKAANGTNIATVGTPSVTASTSGTTTTFTFNYLKGAKGDKGDPGTNATTTAVATTSANGLMSAADKTKLDTISNNYVRGYNTGNNGMPGTIINNGSSIYIKSGNDSINVIGEGDEHGVGISVGDNNFVNFYQDRTEMINTPVKIKQIQAPTASNGSTYGLGTSGQVLKSNGTSVYWAADNNTTYNSHTRGTTGSTSASMVIPAAAARQIHTWWRTSTDLYSKGGSSWAGSVQDVAASALFAMQSWGPTGETGAHSSNYGTALNNSMNSSNFATNLNAMGTAAWVSPCKGDYVIDPYGCIGVIEEYPLGTALQTSYPVRLVYKSNARWNYTCVEEGTLITMSDGTYRPVEELDQGDLIMGWNFENDKPIEAVTLFARQTQNLDKMTYMIFSNGEYISFSAEHELYSKTHQKYMFINDLKEGDIVMGKDGEDVEIMSIHRDIWSFGRKNFYQVVSSNNTYFANNILNAMHPINKLNWVQYGLMQEIPQEIMEIFVEDCREFDCWQFLIQDKAFLKQAVNIQREMKLRSNRIDELKQYLVKTDYVALKYSEGELVDTTIIEQRQASRLEINKLEDELKNQYQPEYNELLTSHALIGEDILLSDTERQIKYFKLSCKRDNENLELFKKYYPVKERVHVDWENYVLPVAETVEESE